MQLEVNKDLMCRKTQLAKQQYHLQVAKDSLSKLLLHLHDLKVNIEKQKAEWDSIEHGYFSDVVLAPSKVALIGDAHFTSSETKTFQVFIALKNLDSKEFQITKKVEVQRSVCDAFEVVVVEGEVDYIIALKKSLTLTKKVEHARSKFDNLQQQQIDFKTNHNVIKCGKGGVFVHPKPLFFFGGGLNSDDPNSTWGMEFVIVTSCAFFGRKFSPVQDYQLVSCLHMYHSWCIVAHPFKHPVFETQQD